MANDGGPAYPDPDPDTIGIPGMSVRDEFAKAIAGQLYPTVTNVEDGALAIEVYNFAQALTDEKLRRDQADRDEEEAG